MWHEQRCGVLLQCLPINLVVAAAATATEWLCFQSPHSFFSPPDNFSPYNTSALCAFIDQTTSRAGRTALHKVSPS